MRSLIAALVVFAVVVPAADAAVPPLLLSVDQKDRHPTATFSAPGADDVTIYLATRADRATDGRFFDENIEDLDILTADEIGSGYWLSESQLDPGTYYVNLRATDWDCLGEADCLEGYSEVLTLTIPKRPPKVTRWCRIAGSDEGLADLRAWRVKCRSARRIYRRSLRVAARRPDRKMTRFRYAGRRWSCRAANPRREVNGMYVNYVWRCKASGRRAVRYRWLAGD